LKLSFRARAEASELRLDLWSVCKMAKVSRDETRLRDMVLRKKKKNTKNA
jgi:hypothetical protein